MGRNPDYHPVPVLPKEKWKPETQQQQQQLQQQQQQQQQQQSQVPSPQQPPLPQKEKVIQPPPQPSQEQQDEDPDRKKGFHPLKSIVDRQMRKTRLCYFHQRGMCKYGSKCTFAHEEQELQSLPDLRKTRVCKAYAAGGCTDETCNFAHGSEELRATELCFKTNLCIWHGRGRCINGTRCRFAHGQEELRRGPGNQQLLQFASQEVGSASSSPDSQAGSSSSGLQRRGGAGRARVASNKPSQACRPTADLSETTTSADSSPMKVSFGSTVLQPPCGTQYTQGAMPVTAPDATKTAGFCPSVNLPSLMAVDTLLASQWQQLLSCQQTQLGAGMEKQKMGRQDVRELLETLVAATAGLPGLAPQAGPQEVCAQIFYSLSNLLVQIQNLERHMKVMSDARGHVVPTQTTPAATQALGLELLGMSTRLAEMTTAISALSRTQQVSSE